jgi:hypothetical protein
MEENFRLGIKKQKNNNIWFFLFHLCQIQNKKKKNLKQVQISDASNYSTMTIPSIEG